MPFIVDEYTGVLSTSAQVDRESLPVDANGNLLMTVSAHDADTAVPQVMHALVRVHILDVNDNAPIVRNRLLDVFISSTLKAGEQVSIE